MNAATIIGQTITITRPYPQGEGTQTIIGHCEWASEDLRNFRIEGFGYCGLPRSGGTVRYQGRDSATVTLNV